MLAAESETPDVATAAVQIHCTLCSVHWNMDFLNQGMQVLHRPRIRLQGLYMCRALAPSLDTAPARPDQSGSSSDGNLMAGWVVEAVKDVVDGQSPVAVV